MPPTRLQTDRLALRRGRAAPRPTTYGNDGSLAKQWAIEIWPMRSALRIRPLGPGSQYWTSNK
eukprot:907290-Alexandrium_andersonii.AAC.1